MMSSVVERKSTVESFRRRAVRRFCSDTPAVAGAIGVLLLLLPAVFAPLLANGRPLIEWGGDAGGVELPFLRYLFAPDSTEYLIEQFFNYSLLLLIAYLLLRLALRGVKLRRVCLCIAAFLLQCSLHMARKIFRG